MNYRTRIISSLSEVGQVAWDSLARQQTDFNPFLSYAFLDALHQSGCASAATGWQPHYLTLWLQDQLHAALPLYVKSHSYGEYVFDWAWADAYRRNGLDYYPKLLSAIPFTPVSGGRLLAKDPLALQALVDALTNLQESSGLSSTHVLFTSHAQAELLHEAGFMLRTGIQFHWTNQGYRNFEEFLSTLERKKRKNISAERRKVKDANVHFRQLLGSEITESDWHFFKQCYDRTYAEHYSTPYLDLDFFLRIGSSLPDHTLLVVAERDQRPIASALVLYSKSALYGRYWGAIEDISCLHFETAYYQPLEFCIAHRIPRFEGGAQGEHKIARGFLPHKTWSAHWLAHPGFANAIELFLDKEKQGIETYIDEVSESSPFKNA